MSFCKALILNHVKSGTGWTASSTPSSHQGHHTLKETSVQMVMILEWLQVDHYHLDQKKNPATICFRSEICRFLVLSRQMSLVARMQQEGFLTLRFTPLAAALLCVVLTFGVESETHGNIACCCWEPWRGAAVCGVCLCLPTFSSHTNGSFERTLPLERPGGRLWMIATPHPSHHFLLKCVCVEISLALLHGFYAHSPPTHIQAHKCRHNSSSL